MSRTSYEVNFITYLKFYVVMQIIGVIVFIALLVSGTVQSEILHYSFVIKESTYTRLCHTKKILTVNGEFPGPTINVRKGDTAIVQVYNHGHDNVSIHWHGVNQPRNPWHDGPAYITQCPIKSGSMFTYKIIFSDEEGTLWWHAHSAWDRATVHGAITIHPQIGSHFPFSEPHREFPIILGEWWKKGTNDLLENIIQTGGLGIVADSYTINGQPGDLYPCSKNDTHTVNVEPRKTYLLRIINAAMHSSLFFAVGGHHVTVVAIDASYTKPFVTTNIIINPGQTIDALLKTKPEPFINNYYIAVSTYSSVVQDRFPKISATALLQYSKTKTNNPPLSPSLPYLNDTNTIEKFTSGLRSLASEDHPVDVPTVVDERIFVSVAMNLRACPNNETCVGPRHSRLTASLNNISFVAPSRVDILEAYYKNISDVFGVDFPNRPPVSFNFTGDNLPPTMLEPRMGTEVKVLDYGTNVEIVLQGTNLLGISEYHPLHLHGYNFYIVGEGFGNFDEVKDPMNYNIVDPQKRNTVGVPKGGWTAIRFKATNPGVWFMHCHSERHMTWGMSTVFIVRNGIDQKSHMMPRPKDMPPC